MMRWWLGGVLRSVEESQHMSVGIRNTVVVGWLRVEAAVDLFASRAV